VISTACAHGHERFGFRFPPQVHFTPGVEPAVSCGVVLLGSLREPPMFFAAIAIVAVFSTGIVLVLRDRKPPTL